jgi:hypothetical protein
MTSFVELNVAMISPLAGEATVDPRGLFDINNGPNWWTKNTYDRKARIEMMLLAVIFFIEGQFMGLFGSSEPSQSMILGFYWMLPFDNIWRSVVMDRLFLEIILI